MKRFGRVLPVVVGLLFLVAVSLGLVMAGHPGDTPVERTVAIHSDSPWQVALNSRSRRLFIAGYTAGGTGARVVETLDTTTGQEVNATPGQASGSMQIYSSPGIQPLEDAPTSRIFLFGQSGTSILDATTSGVMAAIPQTGDSAALAGRGVRLLLAGSASGLVYLLNARNGRLLHTVAAGHLPRAIAVDDRTGHAFVYNAGDATVSMLDTGSGQILRTTTHIWGGDELAVDAAAGRVFAAASNTWAVSVLDATTGALLRTTHVGRTPGLLLVEERRGRVLVVDQFDNTVSVLDAASGRLLRTTKVGKTPVALALDRQTGHAFVVNYGDGTVGTLDTATGALLRTVHVGISPEAVAVDERTGRAFAIANGNGYGIVAVLDTRTGKLLRTVRVGERPDMVMVDEVAGRALVLSAYGGGEPTPDRWAWLPQWLRDRLLWIAPRPAPASRSVPTASLRVLDATR